MRYQVHETENFIGVFDANVVSRCSVQELNYLPYWVVTYYVWDDAQYRQCYALCRLLNEQEKRLQLRIQAKRHAVSLINSLQKLREEL